MRYLSLRCYNCQLKLSPALSSQSLSIYFLWGLIWPQHMTLKALWSTLWYLILLSSGFVGSQFYWYSVSGSTLWTLRGRYLPLWLHYLWIVRWTIDQLARYWKQLAIIYVSDRILTVDVNLLKSFMISVWSGSLIKLTFNFYSMSFKRNYSLYRHSLKRKSHLTTTYQPQSRANDFLS